MQRKVNSTASGSVPWPWLAPQISTFPAQKIISGLLLERMPATHQQKQLIFFSLHTFIIPFTKRQRQIKIQAEALDHSMAPDRKLHYTLMWFCQQCVVTLPCIWYKVVWITFQSCRTTDCSDDVSNDILHFLHSNGIKFYRHFSTLCLLMYKSIRKHLFSIHLQLFLLKQPASGVQKPG